MFAPVTLKEFPELIEAVRVAAPTLYRKVPAPLLPMIPKGLVTALITPVPAVTSAVFKTAPARVVRLVPAPERVKIDAVPLFPKNPVIVPPVIVEMFCD